MSTTSAQRRLSTIAAQLLPISDGAADGQRPSLQLQHTAASASGSQRASPEAHLAGKVAIITGSGKGIGEATARLFAKHGASVVVSDLDAAAADRVAAAIRAAGGAAVSVAGDVTDPALPARLVAAAVDSFGRLDVLVNNAGYTWDGTVHKMDEGQWAAMLEVHCTAPFRLIQAAAPHMREAAKAEIEASGTAFPRSIINISSTSGTHGNAGQANYATAKAGVNGLTKTVAKEWGPLNIRCNAIAYGAIDTRLTQQKEGGEAMSVGGRTVKLGIPQAKQYWEHAKSFIPLQRIGTAEEAAGAVLFLASPLSSYITGQVLEVNGGSYM